MRIVLMIFALATAICAMGQTDFNLVPMPAEVKKGTGSFELKQPLEFKFKDDIKPGDGGVALFKQYLKNQFGFTQFKEMNSHKPGVGSSIVIGFDARAKAGCYSLNVNRDGIYIKGDAQGIFYAFQTLMQLLDRGANIKDTETTSKAVMIPVVRISDYPRFQYRGMHLDVGRHFSSVSYVKKYIDYLASYKYNTFHWHLTEDQGWRIEIKKYPNLTRVGAWRDGTIIGRYPGKGNDGIRYGGFYTQEQIREIVKYAADRYITIIPEIEMPGHSLAALASYPELGCTGGPYKPAETWGVFDDVYCAGRDSTFTFLQNVLDEVIRLFPSKYIHIGGDECPKTRWKQCDHCQQRMKKEGLKDEHELQSYFIRRIEKYLNSKGRSIIGWDEILEGGLAPNATVMSWRGEDGGIEAAKQKHNVIMTPGGWCYFDHSQTRNEDSVTIGGYTPLEKVYNYEPVPAALTLDQSRYVLGAQANVWTEYIKNSAKIEYMIYPRIMALSEVLWSPKQKRNWKDFERRLPYLFEALEAKGINFSRAYYDLKAKVLPTENFDGIEWQVETMMKGSFVNIIEGYQNSGLYDTVHTMVYDVTQPGMTRDVVFVNKRNIDSSQMLQRYLLTKNLSSLVTGAEFKWNRLQAEAFHSKTKEKIAELEQVFYFNKATGKKISLGNQPHKNYPGDGAFTLVNGVQNEKGMARSSEFLGFLGTDLVASIDLKYNKDTIRKVTLHVLDQPGSWIYLPREVEVVYIPDEDYLPESFANFPRKVIRIDPIKEKGLDKIVVESNQYCRYIRIVAKNFGIIPEGNPGAGNPAWLFVDEIEVE